MPFTLPNRLSLSLVSPNLAIALLLSTATPILFFIGEPLFSALALVPEAVAQGDWWRLITGHWLHFTLYHLAINTLAFVIITALFFTQEPVKNYLLSLFLLSLVLGLALMLFKPEYSPYVGLSGLLHGLLAQGIILSKAYTRPIKSIALVLLFLKLLYEQSPWYSSADLEVAVGAQIATEAHAIGAFLGAALGLGIVSCRRFYS